MTGASSRSVERCFEEAEETGTLLVCGKSLKEFPSTVDNYDLTDVIRADLSRNRFADLPAEVSSFFMLEELNLSHNSLKTIPDLSQLQCLATLRLSHNQLVTLPVHVCSLPLRILQVSHNKLSAVPTEIGLLTQLQDLDFSCNDLTTLPSSIGELSSLRNLSIRKNSLHSIPDELSKLKSLITLDFSCNKISVIPPAFRLITSLVELDLKNNPLTSPPAQICLKGRVHIFKYLSLAAQQQEKRWSIDRERKYRRSPSSSSISSNSLQEDAKLNHIDERRELSTGIDLVDARTIKNAFPEDRESFLYDHLDKFDRHSIPETYSSERDGSRQRGGSSGTVSLPGRASEAIDQMRYQRIAESIIRDLAKDTDSLFVFIAVLTSVLLTWRMSIKVALNLICAVTVSKSALRLVTYQSTEVTKGQNLKRRSLLSMVAVIVATIVVNLVL